MRDEGYIGKTMGIIAGGRFDEKIEEEIVIPNAERADISGKIENALSQPGKEWGMHTVYHVALDEFDADIFGIAGAKVASKSFDIVGSGSDDTRGDFKCPGLAHASAYPIELVVAKEKGAIRVRMVDAMFRMKIYFEDAGKWAFMKNMGMPGSIRDEIINRISFLKQ